MAEYVAKSWPGIAGAATRAERQPCRYQAYVPDLMVDRPVTLSGTRAADVSDVERQVVALNASHPGLVNLEALARLLLREEAVASSFIEGLQINVRRLAKEDVAQHAGLGSRDDTARAVLGNVRAMESALDIAGAGGREIVVVDLLELHRGLVAGTRDERWGGVIREDQNWVGGSGLTPCSAE